MTRTLLQRLFIPFLLTTVGCDGMSTWQDLDTAEGLWDTDDSDTEETGPTNNNQSPVANAGPDQAVSVSDVVQLDGGETYDPNGDSLNFSWEFGDIPTDSTTNLINPTHVDPRFFADVEGVYRVWLTADDGQASDMDEILGSVADSNGPPIADAGPDQSVTVGDLVYLDGQGSSDPEGDPLTYGWIMTSRPSGSTASLNSLTAPGPRFEADRAGSYQIELMVSDGTLTSAIDLVRITAKEDSSDSCLSLYAFSSLLQQATRDSGSAASAIGVLGLPLVVFFISRRRRDE